jgi:Mitochondrial carrier protein
MAISFIGGGIAEILSLAFYYPFDLMKTRMQVVNKSSIASHRYNGVLDATIKIFNESFEGQKCDLNDRK